MADGQIFRWWIHVVWMACNEHGRYTTRTTLRSDGKWIYLNLKKMQFFIQNMFCFANRYTFFHESRSVSSTNMVHQVRYRSMTPFVYYLWISSTKRRTYSYGSGTSHCSSCWLDSLSIGEFEIWNPFLNIESRWSNLLMSDKKKSFPFQRVDHFNDWCSNENPERTKSIGSWRYCSTSITKVGHRWLVAHLYAQPKSGSDHIQGCADAVARTTGNAKQSSTSTPARRESLGNLPLRNERYNLIQTNSHCIIEPRRQSLSLCFKRLRFLFKNHFEWDCN